MAQFCIFDPPDDFRCDNILTDARARNSDSSFHVHLPDLYDLLESSDLFRGHIITQTRQFQRVSPLIYLLLLRTLLQSARK